MYIISQLVITHWSPPFPTGQSQSATISIIRSSSSSSSSTSYTLRVFSRSRSPTLASTRCLPLLQQQNQTRSIIRRLSSEHRSPNSSLSEYPGHSPLLSLPGLKPRTSTCTSRISASAHGTLYECPTFEQVWSWVCPRFARQTSSLLPAACPRAGFRL